MGGAAITNFDQCLHTVIVIGKRKDTFRGIYFGLGEGLRGGGFAGGTFYGRICNGGRKFP